MVEVLAPIEAEPAHVALDGVDVFLLLLGRDWCRRSAGGSGRRTPRHAEIEADRLGVADMQVAVRLRRKARHHRPGAAPGVEVGLNDIADEIAPRFRCGASLTAMLSTFLVRRPAVADARPLLSVRPIRAKSRRCAKGPRRRAGREQCPMKP